MTTSSPNFTPFPIHALPAPASDFVTEQAAALSVDHAAVAVPVLVAMAAACGNAFAVTPKSTWVSRPTLWAALSMPSGSRKSEAYKAGLRPILRLEKESQAEYVARQEQHEEALAKWESSDKAERGDRPQEPHPPTRRWVSDITIETLAAVHERAPRGLVAASDELDVILTLNQYNRNGADRAKWLGMFDGAQVVIDRKSDPLRPTIEIPYPNVCIVGTIQPRVLSDKFTESDLASGYVARFLLVEPPVFPHDWDESEVRDEVLTAFGVLISNLYRVPFNASKGPTRIGFSPEAKALWIEFYRENAGRMHSVPDGPTRAMISKIEGYAARFALVLHLADEAQEGPPIFPGPISEDAMRRAIDLARWFRSEQERLYLAYGFEARAMDRDAQLTSDLPERFDISAIYEMWGVKKSAGYEIVSRLIQKGLIERTSQGAYAVLSRAGAGQPENPDACGGDGVASPESPVVRNLPPHPS